MSYYRIIRRNAAPPSWLPSNLSNLWGWWKSDAITGKSDGDSVGTWSDSSGNGYTMTLASGGSAVYKTNILDGKAIVRLSGDNGYFTNGNVIDNSCCITMAAVLERDTVIGTTGYVSGSDGSNSTRSFLYGTIDSGTLLFFTVGSSTYDYRPAHTWNNGSFKVVSARSDHGAGTFRASMNGTETNDVTSLGTGNLIATATTTYIGAGAGVGNHPGDYAEIILYDAALSEENQQKLEGYLAWKWGLQANLPVGHPHKDAAPTA